MKLLIIEDDKTLAENLGQTLNQDGFVVDLAATLDEAEYQVGVNEYDCLILDIGLPDGDGFQLLESLREQKVQTPVIIVTARGEVEDKVKGLNLGADDYVAKPVDSGELLARIRAVIRRNSASALPIVSVGPLTIKPAQHAALVDNKPLDLTAKEFAVLEYLGQYCGQAVTRTMLMEHVWGSEFDSFSNVIDVYIRNLRRKLEKHTDIKLIDTIRGKGYVLGKNAI
jgi:DNA-binding response OmpR family regulator